ncbi:N-acetylmuramic acid 6-phosphate etherase [Brevibacillus dissolubilis]|uniref:N-acetylmuramic acid 6-phosphate etherase n=1 Tax=Brevibacillus dissolubilis TaxID=1844116 RepID=UPI0011168E33|nr:N-acetylmuramic acid 6-phosphate etherase [Brevibacillus dissolubilis]
MDETKQIVTEQRNARSYQIDRKSTEEILEIINAEDQTVAEQIQKEIPVISQVVDRIVHAFTQGGRLIYAGAGTSGRIGTLDASECPPTYGTDPEMVQAMIAGGVDAVFRAVEGAEDNEAQGGLDIEAKAIKPVDVVVGITASGGAPYVIGALKRARELGATTVSFTCNRQAKLHEHGDYQISVEVGPEVITGSTRMKAGTAQKLVLNMLTTASMVKLGKVYDNLMVDLQPLNLKLVDRAKRMIMTAANCTREEAERLFTEADGNPKTAIVMHICQINRDEATRFLSEAQGFVHKAIQACEIERNTI